MFSKQIAYVLFSVIALLLVLFGYSIYLSYINKLETEKKISTVISKFEEKFKNDSIYLANENSMLIDKISQHIIDSVSKAYEKKLEKVILDANNKYKQLLLSNNIKVKENDLIIPKNTHLNSLNVTTYSKLDKTNKTKENTNNYLNITTVSELKKHKNTTTYNNVTVHTKKQNISQKNYNITTYSKLKNSNLSKKNVPIKKYNSVNFQKKTNTEINIKHDNYALDHSANLNDLDMVPVYNGCTKYKTEDELKNCFAINISKHIFKKFNSLQIQNSGLKKGIHKVRVLFIIDKNGKAKIGKLVGKWPPQIYSNVKYAVETTPQMKPGYSNNKAVPVKYSLLIPFIIK